MNAATASLLVLFLVAVVPLAPTEAVLIGYGVLAASGELPLVWVIVVAAVGCTLADFVNFGIGRGLGMRALRRFNRSAGSRAVVAWTAGQLADRGESILVAIRFVPGGGIIGALLAGSLRWPRRRFVPVAVVGAALWSTYAALLGYVGGQVVAEPVLAMLISLGVALLISVPAGMVIKATQRRVVEAAAATGTPVTA
ncbi:DedA family protein [Umezawaea sp. Da 62-37]|uniref:DedA family protein n=1 Tax=Umezawaea sp. Da 62-37 TaxID=3075927 RepID=UPI0028F700CE|nr:DedA family protein [Umezawaea sp. Da 62-37]WNV91658.1 DedA family protein [Umezawaea sp. Da 62-37]